MINGWMLGPIGRSATAAPRWPPVRSECKLGKEPEPELLKIEIGRPYRASNICALMPDWRTVSIISSLNIILIRVR